VRGLDKVDIISAALKRSDLFELISMVLEL